MIIKNVIVNTFSNPRPRLNHDVPHWIRESEEIFFVTVCSQERGSDYLTRAPVANALLETVQHRNETGIWWCSAFVVMPDHVHGLIRFSSPQPMSRVMQLWKSWTTRSIGVQWQRQWFDHRLRGDEEWRKKADYLLNNPVRAGWVSDPLEWPWRFLAPR